MIRFLILILPFFAFAQERICVIVNPIAGDVQQEGLIEQIQDGLALSQFDVEILLTQAPHHATQLAKEALERGAKIIVAVGGDGSVNEIGQALIHSNAALAIIPTGSGNGLARHLGIPLEISQAIDLISRGHVETIDTVRINDRFYLGVAGIGFDAEIGWKFAEFGTRGFLSYLRLVLGQLLHYKSQTYEFTVDGKAYSREAFLIAFANSSEFGNNASVAPAANIQDGTFDLVVLKRFPLIAGVRLAYQLFHHSFDQSKYVEMIQCKEVVIKQPNLKAHIDGEPVLFPSGMHIQIEPASLKVIAP